MAIREHSIYDCILRNALNLSGETALVSGIYDSLFRKFQFTSIVWHVDY